jgi:hypothetical protein
MELLVTAKILTEEVSLSKYFIYYSFSLQEFKTVLIIPSSTQANGLGHLLH